MVRKGTVLVPDFPTAAAHVARFLIRFGAGLAGAVLVSAAAFGVDWRLGLLVVGCFLLVVDWKVP